MSISTRIEAIEQHLTDDYSVLEVAGANLTNVDKNIINLKPTWQERLLYFINNGTDVVWNNWEKVEGTGETLTLNSTEEAPMKINLKGNTSQETTTGKNFYSTSMLPVTEYGITISKNANGDIVLNGTPNYNEGYKTFYTGDVITVEAGTYTLSVANKIAGIGCVVGGFNGGCNLTLNDTVTSKSAYANTPQNVNPAINIRYDVGTLNNFIINPQMEKSSSATTYEPFTNGASPNPDYPQDIHVVSGDNTINVCGKNLVERIDIYNGYPQYNLGNVIHYSYSVNSITYKKCAYVEANQTYTLSWDYETPKATGSRDIFICDNNEIELQGMSYSNTNNNKSRTFTPTNSGWVYASLDANAINVMIEKNNQATTYEAYKGASYPINLPVENLFDKDNANYVNGWIDGTTMRLNTINGNRMFYMPCKPNTTYTISRSVITSSFRTITYNSTPFPTVTSSNVDYTVGSVLKNDNGTTLTITTNANAKYLVVHYGKIEDTNLNESLATIQVEYSSKQNSYTPYGTTPIELCKIGDYQDSIKKSTGKNLFDVSTITENTYIDENGTTGSSQVTNLSDYIEVKSNTSYTLSFDYLTLLNSTKRNVVYYNESKTYISGGEYFPINKTNTFITPNNTKYIRFSYDKSCYSIMLNEGSTALPYEPYGKVWYLNKQIGKVVLNGSESWTINTSYTYNVFYRTLDNYARISNAQTTYCEYYKGIENTAGIVDFGNNYNNSIGVRTANDNIKDIYISNNSITSASDFKTWLSTHNTVVYYVLANPTYTEITDTTLISQLDTIKRSYDEQTNITQVNNDLPFILDVTALKQLIQ